MRTTKAVQKKGTESVNRAELHTLSAVELRRLVRPHPGYEAFAEPFAQMLSQFEGEISMSGIDVEGMRASIRKYQDLTATREAAARQLALIDRTRLVATSSAYSQMLLIYARAKAAARTNPDIALAIKSFEQFMKHAPRTKAATKTPAPTTTA